MADDLMTDDPVWVQYGFGRIFGYLDRKTAPRTKYAVKLSIFPNIHPFYIPTQNQVISHQSSAPQPPLEPPHVTIKKMFLKYK